VSDRDMSGFVREAGLSLTLERQVRLGSSGRSRKKDVGMEPQSSQHAQSGQDICHRHAGKPRGMRWKSHSESH
jgi:hypothetical protein